MTSPFKLMAVLAVSLPLAAAAQAPAPKAEVTLYGTLNVNLQYTKAGGATTAAQSVKERYAVSTDSSNVGVRATLPLIDPLTATAQCETSANVDGIGASGICNRNSRVGIATKEWGTLWYGNWDAPYKAAAYGTKVDDPFLNTDVFGFNTIMGSPGFNYRSSGWKTASADAIQGFDVRASNSVGYWSPKVSGISAKLQHSVNEFANANNSLSPKLWGAVVNYDDYGLSVLAAYENHDDAYALGATAVNGGTTRQFLATAANSTAVASTDTAWRVGAGYELKTEAGATTVGAMFEELTLQQKGAVTGAVSEYKRQAWQVSLKHRYGNHELRARYSTADKGKCKLVGGAACSTTGYGATDLAVGYAYYLASSTQVYLHYAQVTNDAQAQYTFSIGGAPGPATGTPRGADPQALGLGVRFAF